MVTNGSFDDGTNNWINNNSNLSVESGKLKVLSTSGFGNAEQNISVQGGKTYNISVDFTYGGTTEGRLNLYDGTGLPIEISKSEDGIISTQITISSGQTNLRIRLVNQSATIGVYNLWDNVSVKEYLGQEVVPDSGCGSWLFEPQSTNLIPYSEDFSNAAWNQTTAQITSTTNINPSGNAGTFKIENIGSGSQIGASLSITSGNSFTNSWYVKKISGTGNFDIKDTNNVSTSFTATDVWQRFQVTAVSSSTTGRCYLQVPTQGDVFEIWGAQIEQQSYATSYIPTENNPNGVTRNQDVCTNGGSLASINSTEGVLYAEIASLSNQVTSNYISLSDGTYNNRISLMYSVGTNIIRAFLRLGGASQADLAVTVSDITEFHKVAFKYKENDFALWIDGVEVGTDTSGSTIPSGTLTKLAFSEINTTGGLFRGKNKALAVWKEALSDSELQSLTTI